MIVTSLLFIARRSKPSVLMQINMAVSKVVIYKVHAKNLYFMGDLYSLSTYKQDIDQC